MNTQCMQRGKVRKTWKILISLKEETTTKEAVMYGFSAMQWAGVFYPRRMGAVTNREGSTER